MAPFVVLIIIIGKALQIIRTIINPLAEKIPVQSIIGLETPRLLAVFILIFFCLLAGLIAQTRPAKKLVEWLESALLSNLPGYSFLKGLGEEVAGAKAARSNNPILARFDDGWQIGFLVERISEGRVVVFIPDAPSPWSGSVFIFDEDRVKPLEVPSTSVLKSLQKLGEGTGKLVTGKPSIHKERST